MLLTRVSAFALLLFLLPFQTFAADFFEPGISLEQLRNTYAHADASGKKVFVLIVPGHEPSSGGAEYKTLKERDLDVDLAFAIATKLSEDSRFKVMLARNKTAWNPSLDAYFSSQRNAIVAFMKSQQSAMSTLVQSGKVQVVSDGVEHSTAQPEAAFHLFGMSKWANENGIDLIIHVHLNDYPRANVNRPGQYRGFAIYVPDSQYSNGTTSQRIAKSVFASLTKSFNPSNMPGEDKGVIPNQDLIAIGKFNTLSAPSLLIEYGYIYRQVFATASLRTKTFEDMARLTYQGLEHFFNSSN